MPTDYVFAGAEGSVRLSELFEEGKDTLFLYNFMFIPGAAGRPLEGACPSRTSIIDALDGQAPHLAQQINLAVVAKAPLEQFAAHADTRGWRHTRLLSSADTTYNDDYQGESDGKQHPIATVFARRDGTIHHFWSSELYFAPNDPASIPGTSTSCGRSGQCSTGRPTVEGATGSRCSTTTSPCLPSDSLPRSLRPRSSTSGSRSRGSRPGVRRRSSGFASRCSRASSGGSAGCSAGCSASSGSGQLVAFAYAPFVVVQPALGSGLLILLFIGSRMFGERVTWLEIAAVCAIIGGLALVAWGAPSHTEVHRSGVAVIAVVAGLTAAGLYPFFVRGTRFDTGMASIVASGAGFAASNVATKLLSDDFGTGHYLIAATWAVIGRLSRRREQTITGMTAFQRRRATTVVPVSTAVQTFLPIVLEPLFLREHWGSATLNGAPIAIGLLLALVGTVVVSRTQAVSELSAATTS